MLPFALESAPIWWNRKGERVAGEAHATCCGCPKGYLAHVCLNTDGTRRHAVLAPGYRRNGAGVYTKKRPPRGPAVMRHEASDGYPEGESREYAGFTIYVDTTVVCHLCGKRQIVRGR